MNKLKNWLEILIVSTRLGFTSFGGPTAHLGYFHEEYIQRRKWMDERSYADLVALCQFLPGPASSQVGIGLGVMRGGIIGGIISFLGFTLPSIIALIIFATALQTFGIEDAGWIEGLKIVAVVVVAHAILGMAKNLTPDIKRKTIALFALVVTLLWQTAFTQIGVILIAGFIGYLLYRQEVKRGEKTNVTLFPVSKRLGYFCLTLFFGLLFFLPILSSNSSSQWVTMFDSFYRSGSLVFGGGHVVLPLLEQEFVPTGWLSKEEFLAGYGAAQAVPGPLFTFATYIGAVTAGWKGGLFATFAVFLPAFLLILGTLPFWDMLRNNPKIKGALMGVNASVVGILLSALYHPIWTSSIHETIDFILVAILFSMLVYWKLPPWIVVLSGAIAGLLFL
ncbi:MULTISPECIES: chromate transporter [Lysinibacillus]|uniref:chromate transporter n=1 Tax=Lysinibacillus TaxID=400634 RepID=UPI0004D35BA9|nr:MULTISPECIES: chromate transporter [Lysinibacillus]AJK88488.1 ChrA protein [Lysinibacillus fusiformis]KHK49512.1 ChrA protein [Lysinibacillus sp. A1]MEE3808811.1 chromate transporter [Lysinibacillus fusiformis]